MFRSCSVALRLRTHFDLLSIPLASVVASGARVDTAQLQKKLHALQRRFHPDALVGKGDAERAHCEIIAGKVNTAYKIVKDDFTRHRYIAYCVALFSSEVSRDKAREILAANDRANPDVDHAEPLDAIHHVLDEGDEIKLGEPLSTAFLEEMLDMHEEIEDGDLAPERRAEMLALVQRLAAESKAECERHLTEHGEEFFSRRIASYSANQDAPPLSPAAKKAQSAYVQALMRWTYAANLQRKLEDLE
jgi:hypothetical protein